MTLQFLVDGLLTGSMIGLGAIAWPGALMPRC